MEEYKTRSIRATDETFDALKKIVSSGGFANQGEAMTAIVKLWEMDHAKAILPDHASIISHFNSLAQQMQDQLLAILEDATNSREQAKMEFAGELQALKTKNSKLEKELEKAENLRKTAMSEERLATKAKLEAEDQNTALTKALADKDTIIAALQDKVAKLQSEQDIGGRAEIEKERKAKSALREELDKRQEKYDALQEKYDALWEKYDAIRNLSD
jgi:chromosome segregation ATPase